MKTWIAALALAAGSVCALAQTASPVGLWKTIDDATKQEKSLVRITEAAGVLTGKIEKIADPAKQDAVCDKCDGARKGQKIIGMTILEGVKASEDAGMWDGGQILDPNNGKSYKVKLTPAQDGKQMEVRGYIGIPMLGRTQTWLRVE